MLLVWFMGLAVLSVPLSGGRLERLGDVRFRGLSLALAALALQLLVFVPDVGMPVEIAGLLHVVSYLVAGAFVWQNREIPGLWLIALGGAMNLAAIAANGGVMPATASALASAGLPPIPEGFANSVFVADPNLSFLGDIFAVPSWFPVRNVFSPGDVAIALGAALGLHRLCGSRLIPSGGGQFAGLFEHREFTRLWVAQGVSNLGDWIYALAVVATIANRDVGAHALAILLIVQVAPSAVMGIVGGPLVDRLPRKALMIWADLLRAASVGSLLLVGHPGLPHLYLVAAGLGLFGALFQPSLQASLPNLVPKERLVAANALVNATFHVAVMIGPVLGGLLVARLGEAPAFGVNAASFVLSAILLSRVRTSLRPEADGRMGARSAVADLVEGVRYSIRTPLVRGILISTGVIMFAAAIRSPLEPLFVLRTLGAQPEALGFLGGVWGFGMILGAVAAPALTRRGSRVRLFGISTAVVGVAILLAADAGSLTPVLALWMLAGAGNSIGSVSYGSLLQERTPDRFRGRVLAASEAVLDGAYLAGAACAGWLGHQLGVRGAFVLSGLLFCLAAILSQVLLSRRREARAPSPRREPVAVGDRQ
jgi:MFS family permease